MTERPADGFDSGWTREGDARRGARKLDVEKASKIKINRSGSVLRMFEQILDLLRGIWCYIIRNHYSTLHVFHNGEVKLS